MNYHYFIWLFIEMGVLVALLSLGVVIYGIFFEKKDDDNGTNR
jgi:hypothetical protein